MTALCMKCNCELNAQTTHLKRPKECKRCVGVHARAQRCAKQKEEREQAFQHEKKSSLSGVPSRCTTYALALATVKHR